jgi:hypothetical protein
MEELMEDLERVTMDKQNYVHIAEYDWQKYDLHRIHPDDRAAYLERKKNEERSTFVRSAGFEFPKPRIHQSNLSNIAGGGIGKPVRAVDPETFACTETVITPKRKPMSYRTEQHVRYYAPDEFKALLGLEPSCISLNVSGLEMLADDLAKAGWSCKIVHNLYGGRSKVSFFSADKRSTISFRLPGKYIHKPDHELLRILGEGTFNTVPKILNKQMSDEEMLKQVEANIKKRLKAKAKPKPRAAAAEAMLVA